VSARRSACDGLVKTSGLAAVKWSHRTQIIPGVDGFHGGARVSPTILANRNSRCGHLMRQGQGRRTAPTALRSWSYVRTIVC
jgi:hypothetical protein